MKAHIGADAESGLMHHVHGAAANVADVAEVALLLYGAEHCETRMICLDLSRPIPAARRNPHTIDTLAVDRVVLQANFLPHLVEQTRLSVRGV